MCNGPVGPRPHHAPGGRKKLWDRDTLIFKGQNEENLSWNQWQEASWGRSSENPAMRGSRKAPDPESGALAEFWSCQFPAARLLHRSPDPPGPPFPHLPSETCIPASGGCRKGPGTNDSAKWSHSVQVWRSGERQRTWGCSLVGGRKGWAHAEEGNGQIVLRTPTGHWQKWDTDFAQGHLARR